MTSEVLIVGGGMIGLSIARELHKRGLGRITLVEQSRCGEESSWAAAGMLVPQVEADERGVFFDTTCKSRDMYPEFTAELLSETGIDIELERTGTLSLAFTDEDRDALIHRSAWQREAGFTVERLSAADLLKLEPRISPHVQHGLHFPNDWQVENRKLLASLRRYAELNGVDLLENTRVESLEVDGGTVTGVKTNHGQIGADIIVLATGAWTSLIKVGDINVPVRVEPVRGQIVQFQPDEKLLRHVIYSPRGYILPRADGRVLAGSTTEHAGFEKNVTNEAAAGLTAIAGEILPDILQFDIADQWAGLRPFAADGMPVIGSILGLDGLIFATGHYRNGILLAPLTAKIIAKKIVDNVESPLLTAFSPDRFRSHRASN